MFLLLFNAKKDFFLNLLLYNNKRKDYFKEDSIMFFVDETVPTWVPDVIREFIEKLASSIGLTPFITFWVCVGAVALLLIILIIIICVIKKKNENKRFKKEKEYQDRRMAAREAEKKEQEERFAANPDPFAEPSTPKSNVSANDSDEDEYELATEDEGSSKNASEDDDSLELFDDDFEEIKQQYSDTERWRVIVLDKQ